MSTSANVVEYRIEDAFGNVVKHLRQHLYCKMDWSPILEFSPASEYTITPYGYDEEDEYWEDEPRPLDEFIKRILSNKK